MGMCCWIGSHFHDWSDYNGITFLISLLEWGHKFSVVSKWEEFQIKRSESCCSLLFIFG